ncbi:MAG TPA: amidohydrolase [Steroidobacteraceae bacterium]|nr:amidohydrolase [Steroidobacteraceae bacterium]
MLSRICVALIAAASAIAGANAETIVVHNVQGVTPVGQKGLMEFNTIIIEDGRIKQIGTYADIAHRVPATDIDGGGKYVLPGLTDAHGHVLGLGAQTLQVDLRGTTSIDDALARIRKHIAANPNARWVIGRGWNQELWKERRFPTARELDAVVSDRPALMSRVDGHASWANSAALKVAGITASTPDPQGGQIVKDASGQPSGVLVDLAQDLVEKHVPAATDAETKRQLHAALTEVAALGMTGVHDAGIAGHTYDLYRELAAAGQLPIRVYAMLGDSPESRKLMQSGPRLPEFDERLQMRAVKAYADGALGSRGAALMQDYSDQPHHRGLIITARPQMQELATLTASKGWQLNVHAIGDAGNRLVLDTFETMLTQEQRHALRPRIEHAQVIALDDIRRFGRLEVIASIQPTHATSDMNMAEDRVGPQRIHGAYAWRKLINAGARLAGGSDFPVELPNPFYGLYAAVTRQDREGRPPGGWYPEEKLTREEALRLFTLDAAYAGHMEHSTGSLEPGKWADFILVDRDYFKIPESEIDDIKVLGTYVAGKKVTPAE